MTAVDQLGADHQHPKLLTGVCLYLFTSTQCDGDAIPQAAQTDHSYYTFDGRHVPKQ